MDQRNRTLDIAKGIGICLVVLGHIQNPTQPYIYGFHMPMFFILSGMFFKEKYLDEPIRYVKSRFQRLLLPFLLINIFAYFIFPHEVAPWWRMFGIVSAIDYPNSMLGAVWFLKTLFVVSLMFYVFLSIYRRWSHLGKNYILPPLFFLVALICDFFTGPKVSAWFFQCFFFSLGFFIQNYEECIVSDERPSLKTLVLVAVGGGLFLLLNPLRGGDINSCRYSGMLPFAITGILGSWFSFRLSSLINQWFPKIASTFCFLGYRTMSIILFHWIAFYFFGVLIYMKFGDVNDDTALYKLGLFFAGVITPILFDLVYESVKGFIVNKEK